MSNQYPFPEDNARRKALYRRYDALSTLVAIALMISIFLAALAPDLQQKVIAGVVAVVLIIVWYALIRLTRRYRVK